MKWRMAGWLHWDLLAEDHDPSDYDRAPVGEVGHIDGRWYGVATGTLVHDADGWHVPTADDPVGGVALLSAALGVPIPELPGDAG